MREPVSPDVVVYVCRNCIPEAVKLPRQWRQDGVHVAITEVPCSGKVDVQYMFHALEAGARGLLIVACPKGECRLTQGNYRAQVRVATARRLLAEAGLEPERVELLLRGPEDDLDELIRGAVARFAALKESALRTAG